MKLIGIAKLYKIVAGLQLSEVPSYQIGQFHKRLQLSVILTGRVGPLLLHFRDKGRMTENPEPSFPSRFSEKLRRKNSETLCLVPLYSLKHRISVCTSQIWKCSLTWHEPLHHRNFSGIFILGLNPPQLLPWKSIGKYERRARYRNFIGPLCSRPLEVFSASASHGSTYSASTFKSTLSGWLGLVLQIAQKAQLNLCINCTVQNCIDGIL